MPSRLNRRNPIRLRLWLLVFDLCSFLGFHDLTAWAIGHAADHDEW